jgi:hypothetical protein
MHYTRYEFHEVRTSYQRLKEKAKQVQVVNVNTNCTYLMLQYNLANC